MAAIMRGVTWRGCGLANRMRASPSTSLTRSSSSAKSHAGVVGRLIVVDDLSEELHFAGAASPRHADVRQDVGDRPHPLVPARVRDDAEGAELVAALDDGDVRLERIGAARNPQRKRHVVVRIQIDAGGAPAPAADGLVRPASAAA